MDVIYRGPNPFNYHSAPSGKNYMFDPRVQQKVEKGDEAFFRGLAGVPGSLWSIVSIADKIKGGLK